MLTALFVVLIGLLVLILMLGGLFFFYLYYWQIQRPVPQLDGELSLACLAAPVEILRDKHAIPHLYAVSEADLFRTQGFLHAQERLWQMEQTRRVASGRLAELFGEAALEADRFSRIVGLRRAAEAEVAILDNATQQILSWYIEGINAYISTRPRQLAAEFNLLRIQPEPWTLLDVVACHKVFAWGMSINWESELTRLQLLQQVGPAQAADLEPVYPQNMPIITDELGNSDAQRLKTTADLLCKEYEKLKAWLGDAGPGKGSNSWVVAPKHSLTRRALLANDPHTGVQIPGNWYELHMECPTLQVSGASLPGVPGVMSGHNADIAWGFANAMVDTQDLYIEQPLSDAPHTFAYADGVEAATVLEETIAIRRAPLHEEKIVVTRHGPLISNLLLPDALQNTPAAGEEAEIADEAEADLGTIPLALRWVGHQPGHTLRALLQVNRAANWEEFRLALSDWATPALNFTYADVDGNIGYTLAGVVPLRTEKQLGLMPTPGWQDEYTWSSAIPTAELPHLYNPPSGKIIVANHKIVSDNYPYSLGVEFDPGWRAARATEMLAEKDRFTTRDMENMQLDTTSVYAAALAPWIGTLDSEDTWESLAISHIRRWNYRMEVDSLAATVYHYTLLHLLALTFGGKLGAAEDGYRGVNRSPLVLVHGFALRSQSRLLELLNRHEQSVWYQDSATGRDRNREELLQEALGRAVVDVRELIGDNTRRWAWGRVHQLRFVHTLGSVRLLARIFNRGPMPIGGDGTTLNLTHHRTQLPPGLVQVAASYRQIYEIGQWDKAQSVNLCGQSGHPLSPHYSDQIVLWQEGAYHKMPWTREAMHKEVRHKLLLQPSQEI